MFYTSSIKYHYITLYKSTKAYTNRKEKVVQIESDLVLVRKKWLESLIARLDYTQKRVIIVSTLIFFLALILVFNTCLSNSKYSFRILYMPKQAQRVEFS